MIIKTGDAQILELITEDESPNDKKAHKALKKVTDKIAKNSDDLIKASNKTESIHNESDSEKN